MEQWTTIRYLHAQGKGIREIAREVGVSRQSVRRALALESQPRYERRAPRMTKLEPYRAMVRELYLGKHLIGTRILRELRAAGYEGGQSILYDYLRSLNGTVLPEKATVRFETAPGQQGQFDWSPYTVSLGDELRQVIVYGMTLGYSRRKHYTASLDERQASIFEALEECLWHFAGAPKQLLVDNARSFVVDASKDHFRWNAQFLELCGHYRIEPRACQPYRARTKGKIERPFAYLEEQFIKGNHWRSLEHFLEELARFEREDLDVRVHGTTHEAPLERFAREGSLLTPLPSGRFVGVQTETRKVSFDCLVSFRANRYSVPAAYAGKMVWLRVSQGCRLVVFNGRREVLAEHELRPGKGEIVMQPEHYALLRQRQGVRGFALLRVHFLERFPHDDAFLDGLVAQHHASPAAPLREILALSDLYPAAALRRTFQLAAEHNRYSHVFVRGLLEYGVQPEPQSELQSDQPRPRPVLPESAVRADLGRYQQVLELTR
jgi:transposase